MAIFRNLTNDVLIVGSVNGRSVEPDAVIEVPGDVTSETSEVYEQTMPDGEIRLWPKITWFWSEEKTTKKKPTSPGSATSPGEGE